MNNFHFNPYGSTFHIRQAYSSDIPLIQAMHDRVSSESLHFRFLRVYRPTAEDVRQICQISPNDGAAFVATVETPGEQVVGYGYYVVTRREPFMTVEPAVLIEDRYQGQGIGRALTERLYQSALVNGVQAVEAVIHPNNDAVMRLIRKSGLSFESHFNQGMREIRIWLNPDHRWVA